MSSLGSASYKEMLDEFDGFGEYREYLEEKSLWGIAVSKKTLKAYMEYLKRCPNGMYSQEALNFLDRKAWENAKKEDTQKAYEEYLKMFEKPIYKRKAEVFIGTFSIIKWVKYIAIVFISICIWFNWIIFLIGFVYALIVVKITDSGYRYFGGVVIPLVIIGPIDEFNIIPPEVLVEFMIGSIVGIIVLNVIIDSIHRDLDWR